MIRLMNIKELLKLIILFLIIILILTVAIKKWIRIVKRKKNNGIESGISISALNIYLIISTIITITIGKFIEKIFNISMEDIAEKDINKLVLIISFLSILDLYITTIIFKNNNDYIEKKINTFIKKHK